MQEPIAYTYEADTHCPSCTTARFGREVGGPNWRGEPVTYPWPPEDARDSEGNPIGAIAPWDDWCCDDDSPQHTLACGTCREVITEHAHTGWGSEVRISTGHMAPRQPR